MYRGNLGSDCRAQAAVWFVLMAVADRVLWLPAYEATSQMQPRYSHEMQAGDEYDSLTFVVTPEMNQQFLYAMENFHPRYIDSVNGLAPLVHPVILLHHTPRTRSPSYRLAPGMGSVFAGDRTHFLKPARLGQKLRVVWRIDACYEKKGRLFQDYTARMFDEAEEVVVDRKMTSVFRMGELK